MSWRNRVEKLEQLLRAWRKTATAATDQTHLAHLARHGGLKQRNTGEQGMVRAGQRHRRHGGNAALCAALMAREAGASVQLLEASPREWRGGNSQHTRNLRRMHETPQDVLADTYTEEEFRQDLLKVTGDQTDEKLARLVIRASRTCRGWMRSHGVHFQPSLSGALHTARTNAFFMGGGKALINADYRSAMQRGVRVRALRRSGRSHRTRWPAVRRRIREGRAHRGAELRTCRWRLRVQPRMAARGLGSQ
uniref:FAD-dependent oxidoreductase 2 FAD-binding domain-containing protein n=1 Tax=mine drainage metagenome TaxID=410659 RepID=E6PTS6_9ZZZZ